MDILKKRDEIKKELDLHNKKVAEFKEHISQYENKVKKELQEKYEGMINSLHERTIINRKDPSLAEIDAISREMEALSQKMKIEEREWVEKIRIKYQDEKQRQITEENKLQAKQDNFLVLVSFTLPGSSRNHIISNPHSAFVSTKARDLDRLETYLRENLSQPGQQALLIDHLDNLINSASWVDNFCKANDMKPIMAFDLNELHLRGNDG